MRNQRGFVLVFVLILFLAFIGVAVYLVKSGKISLNRVQINQIVNLSANPEVGKSGELLAYVDGLRALPNGGVTGGDLWVVNPQTSEKKKITNSGNIQYIYDWSPDNKYIAVQLGEKKNPIVPAIAVVELNSGNVIRLKEDHHAIGGRLAWKNSDELVYLNGEIPKDNTFSAISVKTKGESDLMIVPKESGLDIMDFHFSPDMQSLAALTSGGETPYKFYSYSAKTNQVKVLGGTESEICGWVSNKIIFSKTTPQGNGIWEVNIDGTGKKQLVNLGENEGSCLGVVQNENKIFFTEKNKQSGTNQVSYYNYRSGTISGRFMLELLPRSEMKVSSDGNYGSMQGAKIINLNSGVVSSNFCGSSFCDNFVGSNWSK